MREKELELNIMPVLALKHSLTIHRRGMRASEYRVLLHTEPPPTSNRKKQILEFGKITACEMEMGEPQ